jgi:hypothetical protein
MQLESHWVLRCTPILLLFALLGAALTLHAETFTNPRLIQTGSNPALLAQGDFNGDGKPDLIYQDGGSSATLHVLVGNGDGTFQQGQDISLPTGGVLLAVADVNSDGKLDLVIGVDGPPTEIIVMLGNGDGTFQSPILTPFNANGTAYPDFVACGVADFNGDGAPDLIVTDKVNNYLYVLLGNNTESFTLKSSFQWFTYPAAMAVGATPRSVIPASFKEVTDFLRDLHPPATSTMPLFSSVAV